MSRFGWGTYERYPNIDELFEALGEDEKSKEFFQMLKENLDVPKAKTFLDLLEEDGITEHDILDVYCEWLEETTPGFAEDKTKGFIWMNEDEYDDAFVIIEITTNVNH